MEISGGPQICPPVVAVLEVALVDPCGGPRGGPKSQRVRPQRSREMVRRVPLEVAYSSALRGAGGIRRYSSRA